MVSVVFFLLLAEQQALFTVELNSPLEIFFQDRVPSGILKINIKINKIEKYTFL